MNLTIILLSVLILLVAVNLVLLLKRNSSGGSSGELGGITRSITKFDETLKDEFQRNRKESGEVAKTNREELGDNLKGFSETNKENNKDLNNLIREKFSDFSKQQGDIKETIEKNLKSIRDDNTQQLTKMRETVDEKLQTTLEKRLGESFKQVSERLELVHKGLGEMQNIATGVGDLKKVLSNVKTRGVLGEYQLENILEQLLTPDQYSKNVSTKKGSQAHVEFAVKLPGKDSDDEVWLPIDSKFPIENYNRLLEAYEAGEKDVLEAAQKVL